MEIREIRSDALIESGERLTIFGAGRYAQKLCEYYGKEHIERNVESFLVSNKDGNPDKLMGVCVDSLEGDEEYKDATVIIALAKSTRREIENLLKEKFKRVIFLEEFMDMSYFRQDFSENRNKEIEDYYQYFMKERPLFQYIEIETVNRCNGGCSFCPVNKFEEQRPYAKMTEELFYKIIKELEELKYDGRIALFSNNEAFLDKRITDFAKYAKTHLPKAYIYITSNGTLLNKETFSNIIPYLDGLNIDIYKSDMTKEDPENIKELLEYVENTGEKDKIRISRINEHAIRSSRGGKSPNSKVSYTIKDRCPLLLVQMVVRPDGKVSLCCNDALGTVTLGDLTKESLSDVWYNEQYDDFRLRLMNGRENINLCRYCDFVDQREI